MRHLWSVYFLFWVGSIHGNVTYEGQQVWRVFARGDKEIDELGKLLHDPTLAVERHRTSPSRNQATAYFRLLENQRSRVTSLLRSARLEFDVVVDDVQRQLEFEKEENEMRRRKREITSLDDFDYSHYHPLDEIQKWMDLVAEKYAFVKKFKIGESLEGRPLNALHVSTESTDPESTGKPVFYMDAATHAREWISTATLLYICNQILQNSSYTVILNSVDFYFVPVVNLDGYVFSWTDNRLWRKTRRPYNGSADDDDPLCIGVDANRNWNVEFGGPGSSDKPCSIVYHGSSPESEPVVHHLARFIEKEAKTIKGLVSFHNWGQQILYPYNYNLTLHPPTENELNATGQLMRTAMKSVNGYDYECGRGADVLYVFAGSTSDWAYEKVGINLSFTLELRDTGTFRFELPADQIIPTGREAMASVEVLSKVLIEKYGTKSPLDLS